jgi:hypothetical protein
MENGDALQGNHKTGFEGLHKPHHPMLCEHLKPLEQAIHERGIRETFRGKPWSMNCREWVYFDCYLDLPAIRAQFSVPDCVQDHVHRGTHDGEERGLVCATCHDAIVGAYEKRPGRIAFPAPG